MFSEIQKEADVAEEMPPTKKPRPKGLFQSLTVFFAVLLLIAYFGAPYFEATNSTRQAILVVGIALIAIFMRRAIQSRKPLWRSMTVVSALLMVGAYFYERSVGASEEVLQATMLVGAVAIVIYLRRAMISLYGDKQ
jgi:uncharacterized membrane protein (UPF0136 family)